MCGFVEIVGSFFLPTLHELNLELKLQHWKLQKFQNETLNGPRDKTFSGFIVEDHERFSGRCLQKTHE